MLIKKDPDIIAAYLEDYSNIQGSFCNAVYLPETEQEIPGLLKSASREGSPITITGAGTGVTGGRLPFGGSVLSVEKLNRIKEIRRLPSGEGVAVVEAGVILKDFLDRLSDISNISINLPGKHQYYNAACAITALSLLGFDIASKNINKSLSNVDWPGRLQKTTINNKDIYLDISHNIEGVRSTISYLKNNINSYKKVRKDNHL